MEKQSQLPSQLSVNARVKAVIACCAMQPSAGHIMVLKLKSAQTGFVETVDNVRRTYMLQETLKAKKAFNKVLLPYLF